MRSLSQIAGELEAKRNRVQRELTQLTAAISALRGANAEDGSKSVGSKATKPRRTMSASARKKIAAAQRVRWAAWKAKRKKTAA